MTSPTTVAHQAARYGRVTVARSGSSASVPMA